MIRIEKGMVMCLLLAMPMLAGCSSDLNVTQGVGFVTSIYYQTPLAMGVWNGEFPDYPEWTRADKYYFREPPDIRNGEGNWGGLYHCISPDGPSYSRGGNYVLHDNYVIAELYEWRPGDLVSEIGPRLDAKRWDGLDCFKDYTITNSNGTQLALYPCERCRWPHERVGVEPLPFTRLR